MTFKLHTTDLSPFGQRAKLAMRVKGLLDDTEIIDTFGGTDALGALAPMRQIPILEHAGRPLPESQIIVEYLEDIHPTPSLLPDDPQDRARARLLARITDLYIAPHFLTLIVAMRTPEKIETISDGWKKLGQGLSYSEKYLTEGGRYAVGDRLSIADIALAPFFFYVPLLNKWHELPALKDEPVRCKAYLNRVGQDPHIAMGFDEMGRAFEARVKSLERV